jgi:hypothetical protein
MEEAMALGTLSSVQSHSLETKSDWSLSKTHISLSQVSRYGLLLLKLNQEVIMKQLKYQVSHPNLNLKSHP